jgi:2-methylcitrate dehydratase PrpD
MPRPTPSGQEIELSRYLASLAHRIGSTRFEGEDCRIVRQHLLDAIAAAFIGCRESPFADLVRLCPRMAGGCGWPGSGPERVHPIDAGMLWSFAIHASVFEDGSREGACHPAAVVVPTIIALSGGTNWSAVDQAAVAGYDVMVRLARSGNPAFTRRGFHPTAIAAPFGAAATASLLLGHDLPTTQSALCLAAMGCAGLMSSFRCGETQPLQVAWSVRSGLVAAMMAGAGNSGYPRIMEEGFYPAYLGDHPFLPLDKPLQYEYAIQGSYFKPYPGCRHLHPSIDALAEILARVQINPAQVNRVKVRTYRIAVETEIEALGRRGDAYFNIPYAVAARLVLGKSDWDSFDPRHFANESVMEVMKKVSVQADPELDDLYPHQRGSIVEIHTVDGSMHAARVKFPLGEPENPLPGSFIRDKFRQAAGAFLSRDDLDRLETVLQVSGPLDSPESLFDITCRNIQPR